MKKYSYVIGLILIIVVSFLLVACGDKEQKVIEDASTVDNTYKIYYVNDTCTGIDGVTWEFKSETTEELVEECLDVLAKTPETKGTIQPIEDPVKVIRYEFNQNRKEVDVYFNSAYGDMEASKEVLSRAAIVKTLTQFDRIIDYVKFYVNQEVLRDNLGNVLRMMQSDFVESTSADIKNLNEQTFKLFYASSDGLQLVEEDVYIHYFKTASPSKVVMESLISGPLSANLNRTFSSDTKLNNVEVRNGTCYVDMNQRFLDDIDNLNFKIKVYSVVNSLCALENVDDVQILIDGNVTSVEDAEVDISNILTEDLSLAPKVTDVPPVVENSNLG